MEKLTNELLKSNINLLKKRVEELGIKNLESPYQLIEYARKILNDNRQLTQKIESVNKKVNNLGFNKSLLANIASDGGVKKPDSNIEDTNSRLKSLDSLLRKIDLKYARLGGLEIKQITNGGIVHLIRSESMSNGVSSVKSVDSARSADETLSATERVDEEGDDTDDQSGMMELDEELKSIDSIATKNPIKSLSSSIRVKQSGSPSKAMTPPSGTMSPIKMEKYEQLHMNGNKALNGWRSFKIPKQQKQQTEDSDKCSLVS